jgi:hypothetical protein
MNCPANFLKVLKKITKLLSHESPCLGRDPDPALSEHNSKSVAAEQLVRWLKIQTETNSVA